MEQEYDYDLFVIGAGSGGISAARKAAALGKKVGICDYVKPSPQGTKWGVGGTCVNVGCIPKKLMHFAALAGELRHDQVECGWNVDVSQKHEWKKMKDHVSNHIKSLNWGYKKTFIAEKIAFKAHLASFVDNHTVKLVSKKGKESQVTAATILIAVGGRPTYLDLPGCKEHCISSDDIFWQKEAPGKTLIVGAGYIALECGGFLRGMGHEVAIMVRSVPLRNFDQDMVARITTKMEGMGTRFINKSSPKSFEKLESGKVLVKWTSKNKVKDAEGNETDAVVEVEVAEEFDTVCMAVGRTPDLSGLNLEAVGVTTKWKRVVVDDNLKTSADNIYALGDIIVGAPELTPVAIQEGKNLANHLYAGISKKVNYDLIATTIFTPLEYSSIGPSEAKAIEKYGEEDVEVYHTNFKPLEWNFLKSHDDNLCYCKLIIVKSLNNKVIALHYAGPHAGEVMQGYAVAVTAGLTKEAWDNTIGIHPTVSEELVGLVTTKKENPVVAKSGC